jgi:hypothetical protein
MASYIKSRCEIVNGKNVEEALDTMVPNKLGGQSKYSRADLNYDVASGWLVQESHVKTTSSGTQESLGSASGVECGELAAPVQFIAAASAAANGTPLRANVVITLAQKKALLDKTKYLNAGERRLSAVAFCKTIGIVDDNAVAEVVNKSGVCTKLLKGEQEVVRWARRISSGGYKKRRVSLSSDSATKCGSRGTK